MATGEQMYGVTPPIKSDLPTDAERRSTDALLDELKRQNTFEAPAETAKRSVLLDVFGPDRCC